MAHPRRLLTREEAARYCSVSTSTFDRVCGVRPVLLSDFSSKLKRYDIHDLDVWIDQRKVSNDNRPVSKTDIIDRFLL